MDLNHPILSGTIFSDFNADVLTAAFNHWTGTVIPLCVSSIGGNNFHQKVMAYIPEIQRKDFALCWSQVQKVLPSFQKLINYDDFDQETLEGEVVEYCNCVKTLAKSHKYIYAVTWVVPPQYRAAAFLDSSRINYALQAVNRILSEELSVIPAIAVIDLNRWFLEAGHNFSNTSWYATKFPFHFDVVKTVVRDISGSITSLVGGARKLVILDLDNTLWGGVLGEVGFDKLDLGGHSQAGEAFSDFQRHLKALKNRGILWRSPEERRTGSS